MSGNPITHLSRHADQRLRQRCATDDATLMAMLDDGACVHIGRKPGTQRRHLLFYSQPDAACFVAIQDEHIGTLVTVLPTDYHTHLAWAVAPEQCDQARDLALAWHLKQRRACSPGPTQFVIKVVIVDQNGHRKTTPLMKVAAAPHHGKVRRLLGCRQFQADLDEARARKRIDPKSLREIVITLGNKSGEPIAIWDLVDQTLVIRD